MKDGRMDRSGASLFAKPFVVLLAAAVVVALLPNIASAAPKTRTSPPVATATSMPHGFVDPGSTFTDGVKFSGDLGPVEGSVSFFLCGPKQPRNDRNVFPEGCTDGGTQVGAPVTVVNGSATSAPFTDDTKPGYAAAYCWRAEFTPAPGSPYSAESFTNGTTQCVIAVLQVTIVTVSTPTGGGVAPGTSVFDTATITNEVMKPPSKVVDFFLCGPSQVTQGVGCVSGGTHVGSDKLDNGVAVSPKTNDTEEPGTYCWRVEYRGGFSPPDSIAPGQHTNWTTECFTVPPPTPPPPKQQVTMVTVSSPNDTLVDPGTEVFDTATVTGAAGTPTGTVEFFLCGPDLVTAAGCPTGGTSVGTIELEDGKATSPATSDTMVAGKYCWRAEYSGDDTYEASSHTDATLECFGVLEELPIRFVRMTTLSVPTGRQVVDIDDMPLVALDTVSVTGEGVIPTGTVKFFLCGRGLGTEATRRGCTAGGTQVGGPVALDAAGKAVSSSISLQTGGNYCWRAEYSGDQTYQPASHTNGTSECFSFTVVEPTPPIRRPPILPRTGSGGPTGFGIGVAFLAVGLVLTGLSQRRAAPEPGEDEGGSAAARPRGETPYTPACRDGPRRSTGPPSRAGPDGVDA